MASSSKGSTLPSVLVTGAAGFIGGHVAQRFASEGWHVYALIHRHRSEGIEALAGAGEATIVRGDLGEPAVIPGILRPALADSPPQAIVHCAARAADTGRWSAFRRANLDAVDHLVDLAARIDCPRFVFVSTTDVYGLRDFFAEAEDELPLCNNTGNAYPEFKIQAERHIACRLPPERWAALRPAAVWGPGDHTLTPRVVSFLRTSPAVVHFGHWRGRNRWPLCHVSNVATTAYLCATLPQAAGRAVNVLDDERTTVDEWYHLLAEVYLPGRRLRTVCLPQWFAWPFAAAVTALANLLNLPHPICDPSLYALRTVSSNLDFSNARLHELMAAGGVRMVTREEGLRQLQEEARHAGP